MRWAVEAREAYRRIAAAYEESRWRRQPMPAADFGALGRRALDVGAGRGAQPEYLEAEHPYVVHCDLAQEMLPRRCSDCLLCEATLLPFRESSFDVVYAVAVYHHLPRDALAAAVAEALRVGRSLVATVWAPRRWRGRGSAGVHEVPWRWRGDAVRIYYEYPPGDLLEAVQRAGGRALAAGYLKRGEYNAFVVAQRITSTRSL